MKIVPNTGIKMLKSENSTKIGILIYTYVMSLKYIDNENIELKLIQKEKLEKKLIQANTLLVKVIGFINTNNSEKWKRKVVFSYLSSVENVKTQSIEGIVTTVDDELVAEEKDNNLKIHNRSLFTPKIISRRNFFETKEMIKTKILLESNFVLSNKYLKEIHQKLFSKIENTKYFNTGRIGEFKTTPNTIKNSSTGEIIFEPCPINILNNELFKLEKLMNNHSNERLDNHQLIINASLIHALFERIHPFNDGNGRLGRILIPIYFLMNKVSDDMFVFMSFAFDNDKTKYYESLLSIDKKGNYDEWIEYFVDSFIYTMGIYSEYFEKINTEFDKNYDLFIKSKKLSSIKKYISIVIKILLTKAYFTFNTFVTIWNNISPEITVSKNTYIKVIKELEKNNLISKVPKNDAKSKLVIYKSEIVIKLNIK